MPDGIKIFNKTNRDLWITISADPNAVVLTQVQGSANINITAMSGGASGNAQYQFLPHDTKAQQFWAAAGIKVSKVIPTK
jgi:hypothetical protein